MPFQKSNCIAKNQRNIKRKDSIVVSQQEFALPIQIVHMDISTEVVA